MGKVFKSLGLSVAFVRDREHQELMSGGGLFQSDITYATATTLCFAYIRDNIATAPDQLVSAAQKLSWHAADWPDAPCCWDKLHSHPDVESCCWSSPWPFVHASGMLVNLSAVPDWPLCLLYG